MTAATATTDRFARERLAGYDPAVMQGATVLVAGAGALAQNLLVNLALSGVGELRIVDFDMFEDHNAPRSPLYPTHAERASLGMRKAPVVATKAHALMRAPHARARFAVSRIQALGAGAMEGVDVVAACVDNPDARAYLGDLCRLTGLTLVEGGFDGSAVSMSVFPASEPGAEASDPCYRCGNASVVGTFSCQRYAASTIEAGGIPAIQSAAATLGGLQAEAIIQALHGVHAGHRRVNLDVRTGRHERTSSRWTPNATVCTAGSRNRSRRCAARAATPWARCSTRSRRCSGRAALSSLRKASSARRSAIAAASSRSPRCPTGSGEQILAAPLAAGGSSAAGRRPKALRRSSSTSLASACSRACAR